MTEEPPLVLHFINRLAVGGLENGLVNLINHMPRTRYRHMIVCLTDCTNFRDRLVYPDVDIVAIHKHDGHDWGAYTRVWKVLKQYRPAIVHTRNLPTMEYAVLAALAGIPCRVHGEHGRDVHDEYGASRKFQWFRRVVMAGVHEVVTVSEDLALWFHEVIRVPRARVTQIYNGVDAHTFAPRNGTCSASLPRERIPEQAWVIGTVGRLQVVKDQITLVRAFSHVVRRMPEHTPPLRLMLVGDGPTRGDLEACIEHEEIAPYVWLAGERDDIPALLQACDVFVLPSEAEGISNTLLEAMATGLPVVATRVGGNVELVQHGRTGTLVPPKDPPAMADAITAYVRDAALCRQHGRAGRALIEERFSIHAMVERYMAVYDRVLARCEHSHVRAA